MAQFLRPTGDQATGSWATTPLWSKVEEGVASDDGILISLGSGLANNNADFSCNTTTDPTSSSGHFLRADWDKASGNRTLNANLELWQGIPGTGLLIATLTVADPAGDTDYQVELTGTETDNITDYTDLYLRVYYTYSGGGSPSAMDIDAIEFEIPDAVAPIEVDGVDGVKVGDSATADLIVGADGVDGVDIGDIGVMVGTFTPGGTDGVDAGDIGTMIATYIPVASDGTDIGDIGIADLIVKPSEADGFDIGDIGTADLIVKPSEADGFDIGDSATADVVSGVTEVDGADGVDIGDTGTMVATYVPTGTDGVDVGDSAVGSLTVPVAQTDGVEIGDSATISIKQIISVSEGIVMGDAGTTTAPIGNSSLRIVWG